MCVSYFYHHVILGPKVPCVFKHCVVIDPLDTFFGCA